MEKENSYKDWVPTCLMKPWLFYSLGKKPSSELDLNLVEQWQLASVNMSLKANQLGKSPSWQLTNVREHASAAAAAADTELCYLCKLLAMLLRWQQSRLRLQWTQRFCNQHRMRSHSWRQPLLKSQKHNLKQSLSLSRKFSLPCWVRLHLTNAALFFCLSPQLVQLQFRIQA